MKARIIATGDTYNVIDMNDYRNRFKLEDNNWYTMAEVELIEGSEPDWQQVHIQAAIAAMQAQLSSYETMHSLMQRLKERGINDDKAFYMVANISLRYADALIEELQK